MPISPASHWSRRIPPFLALALLMSCASRTPFESPQAGLAQTWSHGVVRDDASPNDPSPSAADLVPDAFLADGHLRALLKMVEGTNRELAATALKVRKASLQAGLAEDTLWPQPSLSMTGNRNRSLRHGGPSASSHGLNASVSYEVDLWNRLGMEHEMSQWEAQATEQDRRNVRISLLTTAASLYFQLGMFNDRVRLNVENLASARRTLGLIQAQYVHGAVSALEMAEARQALQAQEAQSAQLIQQQVETRNALAVLADGRDLSAYEPSALPDYEVAPLPAGLPVSLLAQRPDLQAAEIRLRNSLASVDVARLSFYPSFSLSVSGRSSSSDLQRLLSNPVGSLAASIALPFVNLGKARLTTAVAQAAFEDASLRFQQALINAFAEVDNALSAAVQLRLEQVFLEATLGDARKAESLYEARYKEGAVALRNWIAAQDKRRQAEIAVLDNRHARYRNALTALKALGTGISS